MTQIKLYCTERSRKDGNKFRSFSTETSEGKTLNVRFTQDVLPPKESGYLNVDLEKTNEDGLVINNLGKDKNGYPCLWIKEYDSFIPDASLKYIPKSVSAANLFK